MSMISICRNVLNQCKGEVITPNYFKNITQQEKNFRNIVTYVIQACFCLLLKEKILSPDLPSSVKVSIYTSNLDFNVSFRSINQTIKHSKFEYHQLLPPLTYCKGNSEFKIYRFPVLFQDAATIKDLQNEQRVHVFTRLRKSLLIVWPSEQNY